eukprot:7387456-Prymnesium_polylepis.6
MRELACTHQLLGLQTCTTVTECYKHKLTRCLWCPLATAARVLLHRGFDCPTCMRQGHVRPQYATHGCCLLLRVPPAPVEHAGQRLVHICVESTTLATVELLPGSWRLSGASEEVVKCFTSSPTDADNTSGLGSVDGSWWSPCKGGVEPGFEGEGYCEKGYTGPRCERCTNSSRYFESREGRCEDCPAIGGRLLLIIGPLIGAVFVLVCLAVVASHAAPGLYHWLARQSKHFIMWLSMVALVPKMKV